MASETPPDDSDAATAPAPKQESWWETLRFLLLLFLAALLLRSVIVAPFSIPSGSMFPNLLIGDHLIVSKWSYGISRFSFPWGIASFDGRLAGALPARGDVVVFRYPGPEDEDYVKRVIGLPGDTIEVRGGIVHLNGAPLPRRRIADFAMPVSPNSPCREIGGTRLLATAQGTVCAFPRFRETLPGGRSYDVIDQIDDGVGDNAAPAVVPEGHLFVMGDNRDDSLDSRFEIDEGGVGLLPVDHLLGKALIAFWSTDGLAETLKPWTWFSAARWDRIGETY